MGGSHSREDLEIDSSDEEEDGGGGGGYESGHEEYEGAEEEQRRQQKEPHRASSSSGTASQSLDSLDEIDARLKSLRVKYPAAARPPDLKNPVKLYLHIGGNTPKAKWIVSDKLASYKFVRTSSVDGGGGGSDDDDCEEEEE
ncbi:hypothetical protein NL676_015638 [Syzygium grande]|nr:hypothetical protein NL676_015638 [Syzygium grande]